MGLGSISMLIPTSSGYTGITLVNDVCKRIKFELCSFMGEVNLYGLGSAAVERQ